MNFRRIGLGLVALLALGTAAAGVAQTPPAPPAPPLPNTNRTAAPLLTPGPVSSATLAPSALASLTPATVTATSTPSPAPKRGAKPPASAAASPSPSASETPERPQFSSLDGVFEIELQPYNVRRAIYQHFGIVQNGTKLTGYWEHAPNRTRAPLTGTFDGRLISLDTTDGTNKVNFSGYVENFSDMVGIQKIGTATDATPFTAQHRKKERPEK